MSETEKQRQMMAIALHQPGKLYKRNRGVLSMSDAQLHEFAVGKKKHKGFRSVMQAVKRKRS